MGFAEPLLVRQRGVSMIWSIATVTIDALPPSPDPLLLKPGDFPWKVA
ncbi:hypothetical protein HY17_18145 [Hyphomonas sp. CY54-11-8]|nr:hypothetical protein HY17_18145 [Hyphomonas sp. CY54-11-8]